MHSPNAHRNIERTYRDKRGHNLYMVIRDTQNMTMELWFYPADGRDPQLVTSIKWRVMNSDGPEPLETKACGRMSMYAQNLARMSEVQAMEFIRQLQDQESQVAHVAAETMTMVIRKCARCETKRRPDILKQYDGETQMASPPG